MSTDQPEKQLRDFTLSVRLRPDMRDKLGFVSEALGVSAATVASIAIGQYVAAQHASLTSATKLSQSIVEGLVPPMLEMFQNQVQPESETSCSSSKVSSALLPPSVVEPTKKPAKSSPFVQSSKSKR